MIEFILMIIVSSVVLANYYSLGMAYSAARVNQRIKNDLERKCRGRDISIDEDNRNPEIEELRNLHIGKPYRVQVQTCVYEGIMKSITVHVCEKGFIPVMIELENGMVFHPADPSRKVSLEHVVLGAGEMRRMGAFGRILDEEGFIKARELIKSR